MIHARARNGAAVRLTEPQAEGVRQAVAEVFGPAVIVRLFGSRADVTRRGGDIDILVEVPEGRDGLRDESRLRAALEDRLGERRVDILLVTPGRKREPIEEIAYETGVVL